MGGGGFTRLGPSIFGSTEIEWNTCIRSAWPRDAEPPDGGDGGFHNPGTFFYEIQ